MRNSPATMEKLPGELLTEILIRLPAKSVAQKRCVSKPWNALLSEPSFIKSHLNRSIQNNDELLLVIYEGTIFDDREQPLTVLPLKSPNFIKFPVNPVNPVPKFTIAHAGTVIGSVNGLLCFHYTSSKHLIHIWNPSLTAVLSLPRCTLYSCIHARYRFGYDPKTDDYKVVKVAGRIWAACDETVRKYVFVDGCCNVRKHSLQVEVYSMKKGFWESIPERFPRRFLCGPDTNEVFVDGYDGLLHWLCYVDEGLPTAQAIVAFDLGAETFSDISLPDSLMGKCSSVGLMSKKLCAMAGSRYLDCEVWVMEEYGVTESWVKRHVFSQFSGVTPFGFTLKNEFVFEPYDNSGRVALYDASAAKVKCFKTSSIYGKPKAKVVPHVDSLVWFTPAAKVN